MEVRGRFGLHANGRRVLGGALRASPWESQMIDYTIYVLNAARSRGAGTDVECASRADVCTMALKMLPNAVSSAEIWSGRKLIAVVGAT